MNAHVVAQSERAVLRHTFSHFHLDIQPVALHVAARPARVEDGAWVWYNRSAPAAIGLAAPVTKLIDRGTP